MLTSKFKEGNLKIVDKLELKSIKTKELNTKIKKMGIESATFIDAEKPNKNFSLSIQNLKNIDFLSHKGIYAPIILKRKTLVLSKDALNQLEEKYK